MHPTNADQALKEALWDAAQYRNERAQRIRLDKFVALLDTEEAYLTSAGYRQLLDAEFLYASDKIRYSALILEVHQTSRVCCDEEGPLRTVSKALRENLGEAHDAFITARHPALCGAAREWLERNRSGRKNLSRFCETLQYLERNPTSAPTED